MINTSRYSKDFLIVEVDNTNNLITDKITMPRCKICKTKFKAIRFLQKNCLDHTAKELSDWARADREKEADKKHKEQRKKDKIRLEQLDGRGKLYQRHQRLVNQWVAKVRDADEPCCTCGTTSMTIKYDAGHCIAVGHDKNIRFDVTNIHKQCSVKCNQFGRGMPKEYAAFIVKKYGVDKLTYLEDKHDHTDLKVIFPTTQDIREEMTRYRELIRAAGLKPVE